MKSRLFIIGLFITFFLSFSGYAYADTPVIDTFTCTNLNPQIGEEVTFNWTATNPGGGPITYRLVHDWMLVHPGDSWDYIGTNQTVNYTYNTPGSYLAIVEAYEESNPNDYNIGWLEITVTEAPLNNPPVAVANGPYAGDEASPVSWANSPVPLSAVGSSDPDGDVLYYEWDIDSNGSYDYLGDQVSAEFPDNGTYNITLKTTDEHGAVSYDTTSASISNVAPFVQLSVNGISDQNPVTVTSGQGNILHAQVYDAPADMTGVKYYWGWHYDYTNDFDLFGIDISTVNHTYPGVGTNYLAVKTVDKDGGYFWMDSVDYRWINSIEPANNPPLANIGGPYTGNEGQDINFNGIASSDPDAGDSIVSYDWDFDNDGTFEVTNNPTPAHAFGDNGTYPVTLRVTDNHGAIDTDIVDVTVNNLDPVITSIVVDKPQAIVGEEVTYQVTVQDVPADLDTIMYYWDFDYDVHGSEYDLIGQNLATVTYTYTLQSPDPVWDWCTVCKVVDKDGGWNYQDSVAFTWVLVIENQPPVANAGGPYEIDLGSNLLLDGSSSFDPNSAIGDSIVKYEWDINADSFFDVFTDKPTLSWAELNVFGISNPGSYQVLLRVSDEFGATGISTTTLYVYDNKPFASFTISPNPAACGQPILFNASSSSHGRPDKAIVSYAWDFGDGQTGSGVNPMHIYSQFGAYSVTLTVTDNNVPAKTDKKTLLVNINLGNSTPVARAGGPYEIDTGQDLQLDGSSSSDPDAGCGDRIVEYAWDIKGDGTYDAFGATPVISWAQLNSLGITGPGSCTIRLRVTDTLGLTGNATTSLNVYDNKPIASFTANPNPAVCEQPVNFNASSSSHGRPDRSIVSYDWDFGDGQSGTGVNTNHSFVRFGSYLVTLTVTDNNVPAKTDTETLLINVNLINQPPIANTGGPYSLDVGNDLYLDGSASFDPNTGCGDSIVSYEWDIKADGTYEAIGITTTLPWFKLNSLGITEPGSYPLRLRVRDSFGATGTSTTTLYVYNNEPNASFTANPSPCAPNQEITFDARSSSHGRPDRAIVSYVWDFGDGSQPASGDIVHHIYSQFGTYNATLTVTDNNSPPKSDSIQVTVVVDQGNHIPVANAGGPYDINVGESLILNGTSSSDPDEPYGDSIVEYAWDIVPDSFFDVWPGQVTLSWEDLVNRGITGPGTYDIVLRVTDTFGVTGEASTTLNIINSPPEADSGGPYATYRWEGLQLDAGSSIDNDIGDSIVSYQWDMSNDGVVDYISDNPVINLTWNQIQNLPQHQPVPLKLTIYDSYGSADTETTTLTIYDPWPTAVINASPNPVDVGEDVFFDGSSSYHEDPRRIIVDYQWDWNNDHVFDTTASPTVYHSFDAAGDHTVNLKVIDDRGMFSIQSVDITVIQPNRPPILDQIGNRSVSESQLLEFNVHATDPDAGDIIRYEAEDLPDGATFDSNTGAFSWTPTYEQAGDYPVTFKVFDSQGEIDLEQIIITVKNINRPPCIESPSGGYSVQENQLFRVEVHASDPDGDEPTFKWSVDNSSVVGAIFEDGVFSWTPTYEQAGVYEVTFSVFDGNGGSDSETITITVNNVNRAPTLEYTGPTIVDEDINAELTVDVQDSDADSTTTTWDLDNDGQFDDASGNNINWNFGEPGNITIKIKVTDSAGASSQLSVDITVNDKSKPTIDYSVNPPEPDGKNHWYQTQPVITLSSSDNSVLPVTIMYCFIKGNGESIPTDGWISTNESPLTVTVPLGVHTFFYKAKDSSDNETTARFEHFKVDKKSPTSNKLLSSLTNGIYTTNNNPLFNWEASVDEPEGEEGIEGVSGLWHYNYDIYNSHYRKRLTGSIASNSLRFSNLLNGNWRLGVNAEDLAGNISLIGNYNINIDRYKPKTYATRRASGKRGSVIPLYWRVSDSFTGNRAYVWIRIKKGTKTVKTITLGLTDINRERKYNYRAIIPKDKYKYFILAKDIAGNYQYNSASNYLIVR